MAHVKVTFRGDAGIVARMARSAVVDWALGLPPRGRVVLLDARTWGGERPVLVMAQRQATGEVELACRGLEPTIAGLGAWSHTHEILYDEVTGQEFVVERREAAAMAAGEVVS